jgi:ribosomal protein S18 acetylase RimI-like enzyme
MALFAEYSPRKPASPRPEPIAGLGIRTAAPSDLTAIAALAARRDDETPSAHYKRFEKTIENPAARIFIAESEETLRGFGVAMHFQRADDAPSNTAPSGWYLMGVVVAPEMRRRGVARALTGARLRWIAERSSRAYYFCNVRNLASIDLHAPWGFKEVTRDFVYPRVTFQGGVGVLFTVDLGGGVAEVGGA